MVSASAECCTGREANMQNHTHDIHPDERCWQELIASVPADPPAATTSPVSGKLLRALTTWTCAALAAAALALHG